jgi:hypothetical protein
MYKAYWTPIVSKFTPKYDSTYRLPSILVGRHDDADEKARDAARQKILNSHRFLSFSQERDGNICKWGVSVHVLVRCILIFSAQARRWSRFHVGTLRTHVGTLYAPRDF